MMTIEERYKQEKELVKLFPEVSTIISGINHAIKVHPILITPFNLEDGTINYGDYSGKTLDEIHQLDPMYIMKFAFYHSTVWEPLHKLFFLQWVEAVRKEVK